VHKAFGEQIAVLSGDLFAEGLVHRGFATPQGRIVEARQIVMHQRGAMQQFDGSRRRRREVRLVVAAGARDRERQARTNAGAAGKHGVTHGCRQQRWALGGLARRQCLGQGSLDSRHEVHGSPWDAL